VGSIDRRTFEALVKAHQAELYRYMRYLGADRTAAEDLVQETFLAAFRSTAAPQTGDDRDLARWLRGVARNLFLRHCRRSRKAPRTMDHAILERAEATWAEGFLRGGDGFDYVEALRRCLDGLSPDQRRALDLRYAERRSRAEMAATLKMTENGVKSLLRRLRARLAECVERRLRMEGA
jgi:RNA polymerase sigma-70 factor (ECF subfamily)